MRLGRSVMLLLVIVIATAGCATQPPVRVTLAPREIKNSTAAALAAKESIRRKKTVLVYKAPAKKSAPITVPETTVPML